MARVVREQVARIADVDARIHDRHPHRWAARRARVTFEEVRHPELAFDLDRPRDVTALIDAGTSGRTSAVCQELGLAARLRRTAEKA